MRELSPDLVLLHVYLPDESGIAVLPELQTDTIVLSAAIDPKSIRTAIRAGALNYLIKPVSAKQLQSILSRVTRPSVLRAEVNSLNEDLQRSGRFGHLVGKSEPMKRVYEQIALDNQRSARRCIAATNIYMRTEHGWRIFERHVGPTAMNDSGSSNRHADP